MCSGRTLKKLRLLKNFTQQQIAARLGISQQAYSKLEKQNSVDRERLEKILSLLKSSYKELEDIKNFTPPPPPEDKP
jgi:transcriptional regulator with XRE-family HTH domain